MSMLIDQGKRGVLQLTDYVEPAAGQDQTITVAEYLSKDFQSELSPEERLNKILAPHRDPRTKRTFGGIVVASSVKEYVRSGGKTESAGLPRSETRTSTASPLEYAGISRTTPFGLTGEAGNRYASALEAAHNLDEAGMKKMLGSLGKLGTPAPTILSVERHLYRTLYQESLRTSAICYRHQGNAAELSVPSSTRRHAWAARGGVQDNKLKMDDLNLERARIEGQLKILHAQVSRPVA